MMRKGQSVCGPLGSRCLLKNELTLIAKLGFCIAFRRGRGASRLSILLLCVAFA